MPTANKSVTAFASFACTLYFSVTCSIVNANDLKPKKVVTVNEGILLEQQRTIEAMRNELRQLRKVIEEIQGGLRSSTNTSQVDAKPKVKAEIDNDGFDETSGLRESPAYAQNFEPLSPQWQFSITPRTALRSSTFHEFANRTDFQSNTEEPNYWTNGLTFSITTPWLPNTSFLLSGLYGQDDGKRVLLPAGLPTGLKSSYESEIFDFEILARTSFEGTNANWLAGAQYIKTNFEYQHPLLPNGQSLPFGTDSHLVSEIFLLKAGLGGFFNLTDNGLHRIFSNVIGLAGINRLESDEFDFGDRTTLGGLGADVNIGYEWVIDPTFSLSARYRGQFVYSIGDEKDFALNEAFLVVHGPELHFTTRF